MAPALDVTQPDIHMARSGIHTQRVGGEAPIVIAPTQGQVRDGAFAPFIAVLAQGLCDLEVVRF
jgi:hypothetical protein